MVYYITLRDSKKMPAIGWGNGTRGIEHSGRRAVELGVLALQEGILHIDTAQVYGTEKETGEAIKAAGMKREDIWVTTKIFEGHGQSSRKLDQIRPAVEESVEKLGLIPDLLLIHTPFVPEEGTLVEFWQVLESLVEDGTLKGCSLGVSNFRPQDIEEIMKVAKILPVCNQLEFHPYALVHLDPVLQVQAKYGIVTQAYGPLQPIVAHPTGGPILPILNRIAQTMSEETCKEVDAASVLYLWTIGKGVAAITTSANPKNIRKMASIGSLRQLKPEEIAEIDQAGRKIHFKGYPGHMSRGYPTVDLPEDV